MSVSIPEGLSKIGKQLVSQYRIFGIEVLREDYSCTVDFGREINDTMQIQLEQLGFDVTHENSTIYTLQYSYEC